MPLDKKKFKPQNLSGLIHSATNRASARDSRDSNSPAPGVATLTSASGTYSLSAGNDVGSAPMWSKSPEPVAAAAASPAASSKSEFDWGEDDDWDPNAVAASAPVPKPTAPTTTTPWATTKVATNKDLSSEIKKLQTTGAGVGSKPRRDSRGGDSLSRFRVDRTTENALAPRDLMDASRMQSDMRRSDRGFGFDRNDRGFDRHDRYDRYDRGPDRGLDQRFDSLRRGRFGQQPEQEEELDWNSGRKTGSMRREDRPAAGAATLRPLRSTITKVVPTGNPADDVPAPATADAAAGTAKPAAAPAEAADAVDAKELLNHQKEEMQQARQKAIEARLAKEKQEEEEKQQRIAARLAALDQKNQEKRAAQAAEQRKQEAPARQEQSRKDAKARKETERRQLEESKERAMTGSWIAQKEAKAKEPSTKPAKLSGSMRRKERAAAAAAAAAGGAAAKTSGSSTGSANATSNGRGDTHEPMDPIIINLPELAALLPLQSPETVVEKFPQAHAGYGGRKEEAGQISVLLPALN